MTSAGTMSAAAARAQALNDIGDDQARTVILTQFQAHARNPRSDQPVGKPVERGRRQPGRQARGSRPRESRLRRQDRRLDSEGPSAEAARRQRRVVRPAGGHAACRHGGRPGRRPRPHASSSGRGVAIASTPRAPRRCAWPASASGRAVRRFEPRSSALQQDQKARRRSCAGRHADVHSLCGVPGRSRKGPRWPAATSRCATSSAQPECWDHAARGGCRPKATRAKAGASRARCSGSTSRWPACRCGGSTRTSCRLSRDSSRRSGRPHR